MQGSLSVRIALCADQCTVDRFWGFALDAERRRRLEEIEKLVWKVRIDASNEVMRKVEAVKPFFEDELERRRPPLSEPVDIFGKKQGS